ncbi:hypothetical protein ACSBR1_026408 [Camellia fascicularis]
MGLKKWVEESRPFLSMLMVQVFGTVLQLLIRVVLSEGTFIFALVAYRHVVGAVCVAPFALFFERGKGKKLSWLVCFWLFMNALTGISITMVFFYYGLRDTTASYAVNFLNLVPIVTFLFSIIAGIEKLQFGTKGGKVTVVGAILCVAGALTISLYKGKAFYIRHHATHHHVVIQKAKPNWTRGTLFLVSSCISCATWFLVQVKLCRLFPYKYWTTMLTCIIATMQATVVGLCMDRSKTSWWLGWNLQLITIIYSGALATAASFCIISWTVANKGPTYASMFNPLSLIFVAISEALFLGEAITVGSLVGMFVIIVGLYSFLWGKRKESKVAATEASISEISNVEDFADHKSQRNLMGV